MRLNLIFAPIIAGTLMIDASQRRISPLTLVLTLWLVTEMISKRE